MMRPLNWRRKAIRYSAKIRWEDPAVQRWYPILIQITGMLSLSLLLTGLLYPLITAHSAISILCGSLALGHYFGYKSANYYLEKRLYPYGKPEAIMGDPR